MPEKTNIIAEDVTEAVVGILVDLARAYADNPNAVTETLLELSIADRSAHEHPEDVEAATIRTAVVTKLLRHARMPRIHHFGSTGTAYDETQCREDICDGDVLVVESERVVGFLCAAWPVAITEAHGEFHGLNIPAREHQGGRYVTSAEVAERIAAKFNFPLRVNTSQTA